MYSVEPQLLSPPGDGASLPTLPVFHMTLACCQMLIGIIDICSISIMRSFSRSLATEASKQSEFKITTHWRFLLNNCCLCLLLHTSSKCLFSCTYSYNPSCAFVSPGKAVTKILQIVSERPPSHSSAALEKTPPFAGPDLYLVQTDISKMNSIKFRWHLVQTCFPQWLW